MIIYKSSSLSRLSALKNGTKVPKNKLLHEEPQAIPEQVGSPHKHLAERLHLSLFSHSLPKPWAKLTRVSQTFNAINSGQFLQFNEFFGNGTRTLNSLATICILRSSISCRPKAQNKLTNSKKNSPSILKKSFTRFLVKPRDNPKGLMHFGQLLQFKGIHRSSSKKEPVP